MIKYFNAHNKKLEQQLIAWMFVHEKYIDIPEEFLYTNECNTIYKSWRRQYLATGEINVVNVPDNLEAFLSGCAELSTTVSCDHIIEELRDWHFTRIASKEIHKGIISINDESSNIKSVLTNISNVVTGLLMESEDEEEYNHGESVSKFVEKIHEAVKTGQVMRGYPTHLIDLDSRISGWERGKCYLVSGLEKLGKSRFIRNLFSFWLDKSYGCAMYLLEEDQDSIHECIIAERAIVNTSLMGTKYVNRESVKRIDATAQKYMNEPLYISVKSGMNPQYLKSSIQKQKIKMKANGHELIFVVVDYVQRMTGNGTGRHEQTETIASECANIARDENICMIWISQMGSGAEKIKGVPLHTMIKFGKVFKEAAHCIITFDDPVRRGDEEEEPNADSKKIIAHVMQRKGESGFYIKFRAQLQFSSFMCESFRKVENKNSEQTEFHF